MDDEATASLEAEFERRGIEEVRMLIYRSGYNGLVEPVARTWLIQKDMQAAQDRKRDELEAAAERKAEATEAKRIALSTLWAAWIAAVVAVIGVVITVWTLVRTQ